MLSFPASSRVRFFAGILLQCLAFSAVRAAPASPEVHEFSQPNGVTFQARLVGDEGFNYYTTPDGHPVDFDSVTQWWYYNSVAGDGTVVRTESRPGLDQPPGTAWKPKMPADEQKRREGTTYRASIPSVKRLPGRAGAVVPQNAYVAMLLTNFPQSNPEGVPNGALPVQTTPAEFQAAWFSDSTPGSPVFSAREFYKQASYGKHLISAGPGGIKDWVRVPKMREYYGLEPFASERTMGGPTRELVRWRAEQADATFDFGPYDTDNDGFVDITCVVFQGTAQTDTGKVQDLWPIRYFLEDTTDPANPRRVYETNDVNALGNPVKVRDYILVPELTPLPGGASKGFDTCTIGVFCHEYGHGIGWPDLYDSDSEGVGRWCLMSNGCYGAATGGRSGDRPVWPSAWCRAFSNWVTPTNVTLPLNNFNIPEAKVQNTVMRMWRNGDMGPEYFLVENRSNTGWDVALSGSGLLIWHIDDSKAGNSEQWWRFNSPAGDYGFFSWGHYRVALEQSDGRFDLEQKANAADSTDPYVAGTEFSNTSVPNSRDYANALTDVTVTDIQAPSPDLSIRADLFVSPDHAAPVITAMNPDDGLYYYSIPSLAGSASDDTGVQSVEVSLQRLSPAGEEWYDWLNATWGPFSVLSSTLASVSGPLTNRSFIRGINSSHVTPGSYVFHARAVDTGGFPGEWRRTRFQVIPDPNTPNVTFSEPSPWENYSNGVPDFSGTAVNVAAPFTVQAALKMETGAQAGRFYQWGTNSFSAAGTFTSGNLVNMASSPWVIPMGARPLSEGTYTLYARVDVNGVVSPWRAQAFRVGLPVRVTVTAPAHLSVLTSLTSIGGLVADPSGTGYAGGVSFTLRNPAGDYWNGSAWGAGQATLTAPISGDTWYYTAVPPAAGLLAGTYQINASVANLAGETSPTVTGGSQIQFLVDTIAPSAAIASPLADATLTGSDLPLFHGTLSDPGGIGYVNCYIRRNRDSAYWNGASWTLEPSHAPENPGEEGEHVDGAPPIAILASTFNAAAGTWSCSAPLPVPRLSMENGSYTFMVIVADRAGNYVQVDASVVLDFHQTFVWTGATLRDAITWNNTNSWDAAANWSPNGIPGAEDYVQISNGDTVYNYTARAVRGFRLSNGTIYSLEGGSLEPAHDSAWTGGRIAGSWIQPAGSVVVISGAENKYIQDNTVLENRGVIEWQGGGPIQGQCQTGQAPVINNQSGGVFRIAGDGTLFTKQYSNLTPVFNNLTGGRIEKSSGPGIAYWYYWTLENSSDIFLNSGSLYPYANDVNFRSGSALMGGATLLLNTNFRLYTDLFATAAVDFFGGFISCEGSAMRTWSGPGVIDWSAGTLWGKLTRPAGTFTVLSGPELKLMADGSQLINEGTVEWSGAGSLRAQCQNSPAPFIRNIGTFRALGGGDFIRQYGNVMAEFYNEASGVFIKSNVQTTHSTWRVHNAGAVQIDQGWLEFHSDGNHTGNFSIAGNCVLNLLAGSHSLTDGIVFSGGGRVRQSGATVNAAGSIYNNLGEGYELRGGWISQSPRLRGSGAWKWMTGGMSGAIRLDAGCTLTLYDEANGQEGLKEFWDNTVFENYGTVEWQGGNSIRSRNQSGAPFTFNNRSVFRCASAGTPFTQQYANSNSVFNNLPGAKFERTGSGIAYWYYWTLNNESELALPTGDLYCYVNATNLKEGSVVTGAGTLWLNTEVRLTCNRLHTTAPVNWLGGFISVEGGVTRTLAGPGLIDWSNGTLWGSLKLESGLTMQLTGPDLKIMSDGAQLINEGTVNWTGTGSIRGVSQIAPGAVIRNRGVFLADTPSDLIRQYANVASNFYNEAGAVFTKTNAATTHSTWQFHNAGTVNINQGWLEWHGSGTHTGSFNIAGGAVLHLFQGTHDVAAGTPFNGAGSVLQNGALVNAAGILMNNLGGGYELRNGWLQQNPQMRGSGRWNWTGGGMAGTLNLGPGCQLDIYDRLGAEAIKEFWDNTVFDNEGTVVWQGGSALRSNNQAGAPFVLNNRGIFRFAADGTPFSVRYANTTTLFNNLPGARVELMGSSYLYWYYWTLNNESVISVPAATLYPYVNRTNFREGSVISGNGAVILNSEIRLYASRLYSSAALNFTGTWISAEGGVTRTLAGPGRLTWTGGTIWGSVRREPGTVTVVEGSEIKVFADGSELINEGDFTFGGTGALRATCQASAAPAIRNLPGGVFRANTTTSFTRQYANYTARFENSGTVEIGSNYWYLNGWNFVQQAGGTICSDVTPAGHDQIYVSNGAVTAGGTLHLRRAPGFTPPQATVYPILTGSSRSGNFSAVTGGFSASYNATAARVSPLPPAETYAEWIAAAGFSGADAAQSADPDQDGLDNFTEFAFKGNPGLAADLSFDRSLLDIGGEQWITLHYRRWQDREQAGVVYEPGASPELSAWGLTGLVDEPDPAAAAVPNSTGWRARIRLGGVPRFLRVSLRNAAP